MSEKEEIKINFIDEYNPRNKIPNTIRSNAIYNEEISHSITYNKIIEKLEELYKESDTNSVNQKIYEDYKRYIKESGEE